MSLSATSALVGLRDMTIEVINPDGSFQAPLAIQGPQDLSPKENHIVKELNGADDVQDIYDQLISVDVKAKWGKLGLDVMGAITGDSVVLTGSTPNQIQTFTRTITSQAPFFRLKGRTAYVGQGETGDFLVTFPKCKLYGDYSWTHSQGAYAEIASTFKAIADSSGNVYTAQKRESPSALPVGSAATAPTVSSTSPDTGDSGVLTSAVVTYGFNKAIQFDANNFKLMLVTSTTNITEVAATVTYNSTSHTVTITPNSALTSTSKYMAIAAGVKESTGAATLAADNIILFST